jgi:Tfp pilus assembly protein PilN
MDLDAEYQEHLKALKKKSKGLQARIREVIELQKEQQRIRWRIRGLTNRMSDKTKWVIDRVTNIESLREEPSK